MKTFRRICILLLFCLLHTQEDVNNHKKNRALSLHVLVASCLVSFARWADTFLSFAFDTSAISFRRLVYVSGRRSCWISSLSLSLSILIFVVPEGSSGSRALSVSSGDHLSTHPGLDPLVQTTVTGPPASHSVPSRYSRSRRLFGRARPLRRPGCTFEPYLFFRGKYDWPVTQSTSIIETGSSGPHFSSSGTTNTSQGLGCVTTLGRRRYCPGRTAPLIPELGPLSPALPVTLARNLRGGRDRCRLSLSLPSGGHLPVLASSRALFTPCVSLEVLFYHAD